MLFTRWNKNGNKVTCEKDQVEIMEKGGYNLESCPKPKAKAKTKPKSKPATKPVENKSPMAKDKAAKPAEKKAEEKAAPDIVLD